MIRQHIVVYLMGVISLRKRIVFLALVAFLTLLDAAGLAAQGVQGGQDS